MRGEWVLGDTLHGSRFDQTTNDCLPPAHLRRVAIIGLSGAGKTTLGRKLSRQWNVPLLELDELLWQPGWQRTPTAVVRSQLTNLLAQPYWITDNQFTAVNDLIWARATAVVWLDFPPMDCFPRTLRRLWHDWRTQRPVCNGNYYGWRAIGPLLRWTRHIRRTEPRDYTPLLAAYPHLQIYRIASRAK